MDSVPFSLLKPVESTCEWLNIINSTGGVRVGASTRAQHGEHGLYPLPISKISGINLIRISFYHGTIYNQDLFFPLFYTVYLPA